MNYTLKLRRPRMNGPLVTRVQEVLHSLDIDLGPAEVDSVFGPDTDHAVRYYQSAIGLVVDGIVGPRTWAALEGAVHLPKNTVLDLRGKHPAPARVRSLKPNRSWDKITGVTLHQTGCHLSPTDERWGRVSAHILLPRSGGVVILNDPTLFIWHGNGLSYSTIGIEIEGNFQGVEGDVKTLWGWRDGATADVLTPAQLDAAGACLMWLQAVFLEHGRDLVTVAAHRQSSASRRADPGSQIWQQIAIPWRVELGIDTGLDTVYGRNGAPVPTAWDADGQGLY